MNFLLVKTGFVFKAFCVCVHIYRNEINLSGLPLNKSTLFTCELDPSRGKLVFLVTPTPCTGASITDLVAPPLEEPHERDNMLVKYVC